MSMIEELQAMIGDQFLPLFLGITALGGAIAYLVFLPLYFWLVSPEKGRILAILMTLSGISNILLKNCFAVPRPFIVNPGIASPLAQVGAEGYSFPSGHAQGATTFWGFLAVSHPSPWLWAIALVLIVLISLSRVYLGVHFPLDVAAGILLGIGWVLVAVKVSPYGDRLWSRLPQQLWQKILIYAAGFGFSLIFPAIAKPLSLLLVITLQIPQWQPPETLPKKIGFGLLSLVLLISFYFLLHELHWPDFLDYWRYAAIAWVMVEILPKLWNLSPPSNISAMSE